MTEQQNNTKVTILVEGYNLNGCILLSINWTLIKSILKNILKCHKCISYTTLIYLKN